ncbi:response regulator transcription factor [Paenibacillus thiaminolyticus]|uniref:Response regulator transcription factor n=1 Tax=Paenibacillus thiaminolyticus TaxID=49283 RepID=A0AAP9J1F1_PANTH|nr:response regulator transcription factor [Paenibacillus thiaminolyticus]MCY9534845.1 response regulator transcription factor [Paenibacillus thiaminolyticus]MCY9605222.1 response regulator transcription factor [Paenibacillus thiaminolyticus]MCY9610109.1 response regulator transcription factor [Paenibacillus thiaminolyticus]MCY9615281.1 response regulator transcription factor [Paenibacillus thiaminolyticus]MCY9622304.1 response regulator transcription factor [Paenibacillus thiaminolyticus]
MESANILAVDDEIGILKLLEITLRKENFTHIDTASTGKGALQRIKEKAYDIILLDIMLPDISGFELCTEMRKHTNAPIIFISARSTDFDKLTGLGIGGDDYITKPFNPMEVVARIKAILRRQRMAEHSHHQNTAYDYGYFAFHPESATLTVKHQPVDCTAKELELLHFFCKHPNHIFTTAQLYELVWGNDVFGEEKTVTIHISKLRKKLGDDTRKPKIIVNLRGIGYKFIPPNEALRCE